MYILLEFLGMQRLHADALLHIHAWISFEDPLCMPYKLRYPSMPPPYLCSHNRLPPCSSSYSHCQAPLSHIYIQAYFKRMLLVDKKKKLATYVHLYGILGHSKIRCWCIAIYTCLDLFSLEKLNNVFITIFLDPDLARFAPQFDERWTTLGR